MASKAKGGAGGADMPSFTAVAVGERRVGKSAVLAALRWAGTAPADRPALLDAAGVVCTPAEREAASGSSVAWPVASVGVEALLDGRRVGRGVNPLKMCTIRLSGRRTTLVDVTASDRLRVVCRGLAISDVVVHVCRGEMRLWDRELRTLRSLAAAAFALGVKSYVVAVTGLSGKAITSADAAAALEEVTTTATRSLTKLGYKAGAVRILPVDAASGANIAAKADVPGAPPQLACYKGPSLAQILSQVQTPARATDKPLRIPIAAAFGDSSCHLVGRVATGQLEASFGGVRAHVTPVAENDGETGLTVTAASVRVAGEDAARVAAGEMAGIRCIGLERSSIRAGCVLGLAGPNQPRCVVEFTAQIVLIKRFIDVRVGWSPTLHIHTAAVPVRVVELVESSDRRTGLKLEDNPSRIRDGEAGTVRFRVMRGCPVVIEPFTETPALGRFVLATDTLRGGNMISGVGVVKEVVYKGSPHTQHYKAARGARHQNRARGTGDGDGKGSGAGAGPEEPAEVPSTAPAPAPVSAPPAPPVMMPSVREVFALCRTSAELQEVFAELLSGLKNNNRVFRELDALRRADAIALGQETRERVGTAVWADVAPLFGDVLQLLATRERTEE